MILLVFTQTYTQVAKMLQVSETIDLTMMLIYLPGAPDKSDFNDRCLDIP